MKYQRRQLVVISRKEVYDVGSAAGRMGADFGIGPEEKKKNKGERLLDNM